MARARSTKRYLLDPRFQLKWTSYLVVVVLVVMAALGFQIARMAERASDSAQIAVTQAEKAFKESKTNNILAQSAVEMSNPENAGLAAAMNESLAEVDKKQAKNLADVKRLEQEIDRDRKRMRLLLLGAGLVLLVILTLMGIVITHRIVGPVYKMKRLLRRVSTGRLVVDARLRRGDELEDLFETFLQMTYSLRAMQNARIATLDATLRHAEENEASPEVLAGLKALRAQLLLGLEKRHSASMPPPASLA
jgi:nitrogen fixation/metabolism regulation signal transduction histidine kinase